jgi:hypothetical protein
MGKEKVQMMNFLVYFLIFINFLTWLIFYKYKIDKNATINDLVIKRDKYKQSAWNLRTEQNPLQDSFDKFKELINNFKSGQQLLAKDIEETEDLNNPEVKKNMIDAVLNLEFYSEISKNGNK